MAFISGSWAASRASTHLNTRFRSWDLSIFILELALYPLGRGGSLPRHPLHFVENFGKATPDAWFVVTMQRVAFCADFHFSPSSTGISHSLLSIIALQVPHFRVCHPKL
jgi:hypothetical protein